MATQAFTHYYECEHRSGTKRCICADLRASVGASLEVVLMVARPDPTAHAPADGPERED
jgi:hypothetical protein